MRRYALGRIITPAILLRNAVGLSSRSGLRLAVSGANRGHSSHAAEIVVYKQSMMGHNRSDLTQCQRERGYVCGRAMSKRRGGAQS